MMPVYEGRGRCAICENKVTYTAETHYFRSSLRCPVCDSVPRHRSLYEALEMYAPRWRTYRIHECSPGVDALSKKISANCAEYVASQFRPDLPDGIEIPTSGRPWPSYRNINLEKQNFRDESFDLVITQDVFEHLFDPAAAIREVERTLRPGGAFISTVPITKGFKRSERRAKLVAGQIEYLIHPPEYHGNPVSGEGSLVTIDWGYDIAAYLGAKSGLSVCILNIQDVGLGIMGSMCEVVIGLKPESTERADSL